MRDGKKLPDIIKLPDIYTPAVTLIKKMLSDKDLPLETRNAIALHTVYPWLNDKNFAMVLVSPTKDGLDDFLLDRPFARALERDWWFPSEIWWMAHMKVSHGGGQVPGLGCDLDAHVNFLSQGGEYQEFYYAASFKDQTLKVLGKSDFELECRFWKSTFGDTNPQIKE